MAMIPSRDDQLRATDRDYRELETALRRLDCQSNTGDWDEAFLQAAAAISYLRAQRDYWEGAHEDACEKWVDECAVHIKRAETAERERDEQAAATWRFLIDRLKEEIEAREYEAHTLSHIVDEMEARAAATQSSAEEG